MTGIVLLLAYALLTIVTTVLFTRQEQNNESFHVADRNMGTTKSAMSIAATWIWAPALLVSAEQAYTNGFPGVFWFIVPNVLCLMIFIPFAKKIRQQMPNGITLSGYMGEKYQSKKVKDIYMVQLGGLAVLSTGVQLLAGAKILTMVTGLPFFWLTVILAAITYAYSQFSGIRASVLTDVVQMAIMLIACAIFVPWILRTNNGADALVKGLLSNSGQLAGIFSEKGLKVLFAFGLPTAIGLISGPFGDQCFWQRAFCINRRKIGRAFVLGAVIFAVVPLSMAVIGFVAAGSGYAAADKSVVNLELITHLLPAWATIPFVLMLISGLMSTLDSNLCAIASLTTDLQVTGKLDDHGKVRISRLSMALLLVAGILIANIPGLTVTNLFMIYGILRATTLVPTVLTLLGKKLTANAVFAGVLAALVVGLPLFAYGTLKGISACKTIGCLATLGCAALGCLLVTSIEKRRA